MAYPGDACVTSIYRATLRGWFTCLSFVNLIIHQGWQCLSQWCCDFGSSRLKVHKGLGTRLGAALESGVRLAPWNPDSNFRRELIPLHQQLFHIIVVIDSIDIHH